MNESSPRRFSLGSRVSVNVLPSKSTLADGGELLCLSLIVETPWGPIRTVIDVESRTLRAMLVWARSNYGMMAYDFVAARSSMGEDLAKLHTRRR